VSRQKTYQLSADDLSNTLTRSPGANAEASDGDGSQWDSLLDKVKQQTKNSNGDASSAPEVEGLLRDLLQQQASMMVEQQAIREEQKAAAAVMSETLGMLKELMHVNGAPDARGLPFQAWQASSDAVSSETQTPWNHFFSSPSRMGGSSQQAAVPSRV